MIIPNKAGNVSSWKIQPQKCADRQSNAMPNIFPPGAASSPEKQKINVKVH